MLATFALTVSCTRTPPLNQLLLIELELTGVPAKQQRVAFGEGGEATYGLFLDQAQTLAWGDGSANTHSITDDFVIVGNRRTVTRSYTLYGRVDGG